MLPDHTMSSRARLTAVLVVVSLFAVACTSSGSKSGAPSSPAQKSPATTDELSKIVVQSSDLPASGWTSAPGVIGDDKDERLPTCLGTLGTRARIVHKAAGSNFSGPDGLLIQSQARSFVSAADVTANAAALANLDKSSACYAKQGKDGFTDPKVPDKKVTSEFKVNVAPADAPKSLRFVGEGAIVTTGPDALQNVSVKIYLGFFLIGSTEVLLSFLGSKGKIIPTDLRDQVLADVGKRLNAAA